LKFLIDAQLPPALGFFLKSRGCDTSHVIDLGMGDADDGMFWAYALKNNCALITKDEDFAQRSWRAVEKVPVVWIRIGNCTNRVLIITFSPLLPTI
jgi:predicted nuclease of predicted toxin-antitoxin system